MSDAPIIISRETNVTLVDFGRAKRAPEDLHGGGPGGTSGGVTDDWKASVDRQLGQLHSDVRKLLGAGIAATVILVSAIGGLYFHVDSKVGALDDQTRNSFHAVDDRFRGIDDRLRALEVQQARMDAKLDRLLDRAAPNSGKRRNGL